TATASPRASRSFGVPSVRFSPSVLAGAVALLLLLVAVGLLWRRGFGEAPVIEPSRTTIDVALLPNVRPSRTIGHEASLDTTVQATPPESPAPLPSPAAAPAPPTPSPRDEQFADLLRQADAAWRGGRQQEALTRAEEASQVKGDDAGLRDLLGTIYGEVQR